MKDTRKGTYSIPTLSVLFLLLAATVFISIGYSAYSSENSILLAAEVDYGNEIRITGISVEPELTIDATTNYDEYTNNSILTGITLLNENSKIVYRLNITNYSDIEQGILEFTNVPSDLVIKPIGYELKTKLCDEDNKCTRNYKDVLLEISYADGTYIEPNKNFDLDIGVVFKPVYNIVYEDFNDDTLPNVIMDGETLSITHLEEDGKEFILTMGGEKLTENDFSYDGQTLIIENVTGDLNIKYRRSLIATFTYKTANTELRLDKYADDVYVLNGYTKSNVTLFTKIEGDNIIMDTTKSKLVTETLPVSNPIYKSGKRYRISYSPISGIPDNDVFFEFAFGIRKNESSLDMFNVPKLTTKSTATGTKFNISDSVSSSYVIDGDGVMLSALFNIKANTTFEDFKFVVKCEELQQDIPTAPVVREDRYNKGDDFILLKKFEDGTYSLSAAADNQEITVYVNLDVEDFKLVTSKSKLLSTVPVANPKYNQNHKYRIKYTPIQNVPSNKELKELAVGIRKNVSGLQMFDSPKLTNDSSTTGLIYDLSQSITTEDILTEDGSILSAMFRVSKGYKIDDFRFKIEIEEVIE